MILLWFTWFSPTKMCKTAVITIRHTEMSVQKKLRQFNICPQRDTFERKQMVCVLDIDSYMYDSTFICGAVQLYLCYCSFKHVMSVYVNLSPEATFTCGTRVVSMASILVFCCAESWFTRIKSKGTPEVLSVTRSWKFISTYWSHLKLVL